MEVMGRLWGWISRGILIYIKRDPEPIVRENLDLPGMIAILGPRQSGKTALM